MRRICKSCGKEMVVPAEDIFGDELPAETIEKYDGTVGGMCDECEKKEFERIEREEGRYEGEDIRESIY